MKESDYSIYIKSFSRLFEAYDACLPYLEVGDDFKLFAERKRHWLDRLKSPGFPVAFLGAFSAGKSTIINAILGEDILPQATKSFTAIPTLISRGSPQRAVIHYLGEAEREELKNLYVEEISKELRRPIADYLKLERSELLRRLESDIDQHVKQLGTFGKQKFFDELKILIKGWKKLNGDIKEIKLEDLPHYVTEDYDDVLFVDKAELFLTHADIPENITLVDLPGLGVVNPRHRKVTKSYVENDAKAFVISMKVFHLLEGEEIELLAEINSQRQKVLQRAFWAINQWDVLTARQKREEQANFDQKIEGYGFNIHKDRVFRVSALNYLLLKLITEGKLEKGGKSAEHADTLIKSLGKIPDKNEAATALKSLEEAKAFGVFRTSLFDYLANTAKGEFLNEARAEYGELASRLKDKLEPLYQLYRNKNDDTMRNAFIASELSRRQDEILTQLRSLVEDHIKVLRTDILPALMFWRDDNQRELEDHILEAFEQLDRKDLKNDLIKGLDQNNVVSRLPHKIEENLHIQRLFRNQLLKLLDDQIIREYLSRLLEAIKEKNILPEDMLLNLDDRLSGRDLGNRMKGMSDVFLFNYGDVIDDLGRSIMNGLNSHSIDISDDDLVLWIRRNSDIALLNMAREQGLIGPHDGIDQLLAVGNSTLKTLYSRHVNSLADTGGKAGLNEIDRALDFYKNGLLEYTRKQQDQINKYARRGIKNYFEEIEVDLLSYFDSQKGLIAKTIMQQLISNIDADLNGEIEKQRIIKEAYQLVSNRNS